MYDHISGQRKSQVQSEEESKRINEDMVTLEAYGELNGKSKSMLWNGVSFGPFALCHGQGCDQRKVTD